MNKKPDISFIPINRSLFSHYLWREKRTFSKAEAWLDMIVSARFDVSEAKELVDGKLMVYGRGQWPAAIRFLMNRWGWTKHGVESFLRLLKEDGMISIDNNQGQNVITLLNYATHNPLKPSNGHKTGQQNPPPEQLQADLPDSKPDEGRTDTGQTPDKANNVNKGNNVITPVSERAAAFENFRAWVKINAPRINQLQDPLTIDQYFKLLEKYPKEVIAKVAKAMHNKKDLLKDYVSANLTIQNWADREMQTYVPKPKQAEQPRNSAPLKTITYAPGN